MCFIFENDDFLGNRKIYYVLLNRFENICLLICVNRTEVNLKEEAHG